MNYFGTNLTEPGHFFWKLEGEYISRVPGGFDNFKQIPFDPEAMPKTKSVGEAEFYHIKEYSVLAVCGAPADDRGGCKSVFWVKEKITADQMISRVMAVPAAEAILNKLKRPIKLIK